MKKLIAFIAVTLVSIAGFAILADRSLQKDLENRFPEIDPTILKKAYLQFLKDAVSGKHGDIQNADDRQMDRMFLAHVQTLQQ